jgi:CBS domain-containing protein
MLTRDVMVKDFVTATKGITARECINLLFKRHVGSVIVVDENQECVGIFTERDAIRLIAQNISLDSILEKVMSRNVYTISEDATFSEAKKMMKLHRIRHIPVIKDQKIVGIVSIRHIFDELLDMQ